MLKEKTITWKDRRILLVSNRFPITVKKEKGRLYFRESIGGLATGLSSIHKEQNYVWVGWPGFIPSSSRKKEKIESILSEKYNCYPIFISRIALERFYYGFCNETLWPLFHSFPRTTRFDSMHWKYYKKINEQFCYKILDIAKPDDVIWIHDYHLM